MSYFRVFGCKCFILDTKENVGKFQAKSDQGIFLRYSNVSKAYKVYNIRTYSLEESINIKFNEHPEPKERNEIEEEMSMDLSKDSRKVDFKEVAQDVPSSSQSKSQD